MKTFESFQMRAGDWAEICFGSEISKDPLERSHRFIEEAIELVQAIGCHKSQVIELVDYVFSRDKGDAVKEVGGTMLTLGILCESQNINLIDAAENELLSVWEKIDKIRQKRARKTSNSPLP